MATFFPYRRLPIAWLALAALTLLPLLAAPARAAWPGDPTVNVKVPSSFDPFEASPRIPLYALPDSGGGALVVIDAFMSAHSGDGYVMQRVDANGNVRWGTGVTLPSCGISNNWSICPPVPDGSGGAWLATDAGSQVAVYRVSADGVLGPQTVVTPPLYGLSNFPVVASDGAGGVLVAWADGVGYRAQRVSSADVAMWAAGGVRMNTTTLAFGPVSLVADGAGGAMLFGVVSVSSQLDIRVFSVSGAGVLRTPAAGAVVCAAAGTQTISRYPSWMANRQPWAVSDGTGGAVAVWDDYRADARGDLYCLRVDSLGTSFWATNGVPVCTRTGASGAMSIASDGAGGVIVAWQDSTHTTGGITDIYAQRVDASGTPRWALDGIAVCAAPANQSYPAVCTRSAVGAIVGWEDRRNYSNTSIDLYAQALDGDGNPLWAVDGAPVCTVPRNQSTVVLAPVSDHAAVAFWADQRVYLDYAPTYSEIHAQLLPMEEAPLVGVEPPPSLAPLTRLRVAPNPACASARVALVRDGSPRASLELLDIAGRVARARDVSTLAPGAREVMLDDLGALPAGVYVVRVRQGERVDGARLMLMH